MNTLVINSIQSVMEAAIAVLVPIVIHYVLTKISKEKLVKYSSLADMVVKAVEQTMGTAENVAKRAEAEKRMSALTNGVLSPDTIDHLLEAAVFAMKQDAQKALNK